MICEDCQIKSLTNTSFFISHLLLLLLILNSSALLMVINMSYDVISNCVRLWSRTVLIILEKCNRKKHLTSNILFSLNVPRHCLTIFSRIFLEQSRSAGGQREECSWNSLTNISGCSRKKLLMSTKHLLTQTLRNSNFTASSALRNSWSHLSKAALLWIKHYWQIYKSHS